MHQNILESSSVAPQCMQCHRPWTHQYIRETFGSTFVKKLADIQKNVLFTEQLTLIPYTQEYVNLVQRHESIKEREKEICEEIVQIQLERDNIFNKLYKESVKKYKKCLYIHTTYKQLKETKENKHEALTEDQEKFYNLMKKYKAKETEKYHKSSERLYVFRHMARISDPERFPIRNNVASSSSKSSQSAENVKIYLKPCGKNDCKGYVNKKDNTCELCKTVYCSKCMEEKHENHECKEEDIQTVKLLRKDTKNCPSCATLIHRISGCPDMFCVKCKTAFNWNTLQINKRGNSNPHYYQWLRHSNQTNTDQQYGCGRALYTYDVYRCQTYRNLSSHQQDTISRALQRLHHYDTGFNSNVVFKDYHKTRHNDFHVITLQYRADYIRNKITEDKFKQLLLRSNKAKEYNNNITEILSSIREFRQGLIQNIVHSNEFNYDLYLQEITSFVNYINECYIHLEAVYYNNKSTKRLLENVCYLQDP